MIKFPYQNLGLDLVRATEAAALEAGRWMGLGQPDGADHYATIAMQEALNKINIDGRIALSEIDKLSENAPLHLHQSVGTGTGLKIDLVVDPVEGRELLARGYPDAISVAVGGPRGSF